MIKYGLIGLTAVAVDLAVYFLLVNYFLADPIFATLISVAVATIYGFFLNARWNFRVTDGFKMRLASYVVVSLLGLVLSGIFVKYLLSVNISANLAKPISLPFIVVLQYILNIRFTFKKKASLEKDYSFVMGVDKNTRSKKHVAIIGAGFTGLTAAYELSKRGYNVTIYEKHEFVGGLVSNFSQEGVRLERAYHFLYKTDSEIIDLVKELGIEDKLFFNKSSISLYYDNKLYPFMTPGDLLKFKPLSLFNRLRAGLTAVYLSVQKDWSGFKDITAMDWLRKWAGERVTKVIWEPILRGKFFEYYDKVSMSYVWNRVFVRANSKMKGESVERLGYFKGGFSTFTDRLTELCLAQGVAIRNNSSISHITDTGKGSTTITDQTDTQTYDAVISTTPSYVFSKMIENNKQVEQAYLDKLNSINYLGAVTMVFTTKEPISEYYWHNINDVSKPFLVLLGLTALVGEEIVDGKYIYYIGAYLQHSHKYFNSPNEEIEDEWFSGLAEIFPDFDRDNVTSVDVFKFKNAQHVVTTGYEKSIPGYRSPVPNVFLANFTQIYPEDRGTNYAVRDGKRVAGLVDQEIFKHGKK